MLKNRFENCRTLKDLYNVFGEAMLDFNSLTVEELDSVAKVFEAHVEARDMPDVPLNDKGYTYIWNYVVDAVETEEKIMNAQNNTATVNNATPIKEEKVMDNKVNAAVDDLMDKFAHAASNIKVKAGETYEELVDKTDESLNTMKEAFGNTLGTLDLVLGYTILKNSILEMMDASLTNGGKKDLFRMARKCRELIEDEIEELEFWGDQESLKKAVQLKALTEGVRGKSIFEAFVSGIIWIVKKVTRKLSKVFPNVDEMKDGLFKSICTGLRSFANVLKAGVKIVWNVTKFAASFVVSGVVMVVDFLFRAIKTFVSKIKGWAIHKDEELVEDFEEIDDEGDGVFGTNLA